MKLMHDAFDPAVFSWSVRVYYEDTDAGGVVFYANYLKFFERARTEWLRHAGISQHALTQSDGVMFIVKSTGVDYVAPAKLDDELKLTVLVQRFGRASVEFVQQAWREDARGHTLLAEGRIRIACVECASFKLCAIPAAVSTQLRTMMQMPVNR